VFLVHVFIVHWYEEDFRLGEMWNLGLRQVRRVLRLLSFNICSFGEHSIHT
jgi:hypothetical protein